MSQNDYTSFKAGGKKRANKQLPDMSDSESDFEMGSVPKHVCADPMIEGGSNLSDMINKMDALEKAVKQAIDQREEHKQSVSSLQSEKQSLERQLSDFKNGLSCIICKSLAKFPWQITPCCHILMCSTCGNRWMMVESSCPHCRSVVTPENCHSVAEVRPLNQLFSTLDIERNSTAQ